MNRRTLRRIANGLALLFVALAAYLLVRGVLDSKPSDFGFAFFSLLAAFACIQLRIRAGGRRARTPFLYFHIATAVPFLLSIAVLAFLAQPVWLVPVMGTLGFCTALSGSMFFLRPNGAY